MDRYLENIEHKAAVLCDALPYIRDFVHKVIVIEYDCGEWLSGMEEKKMIKDIVLLKSIGVIPIVVHRTQMGVDKFRENKRIAKLLELYDTKAIGICGVDIETIQMMIKNDYIPVLQKISKGKMIRRRLMPLMRICGKRIAGKQQTLNTNTLQNCLWINSKKLSEMQFMI